MSPRDHLALMVDERDALGEEAGNSPDSDLTHLLRASVKVAKLERQLSALTKRVDQIVALPEIAAALARQVNRGAY